MYAKNFMIVKSENEAKENKGHLMDYTVVQVTNWGVRVRVFGKLVNLLILFNSKVSETTLLKTFHQEKGVSSYYVFISKLFSGM